jgi:hypothetical protein
MIDYTCKSCGADDKQSKGQWWGLSNYHGLSGRFCSDCYEKVSHDSYGKPNHPADYSFMLLKMAD